MARRFASCVLGGALAVCLLASGPHAVLATVVFDDHFTGNSGGVPTGWTGEGNVTDAGTTVTLVDDAWIWTDQTFDVNTGFITITTEFAGTDLRNVVVVIDPLDNWNHLFVYIWLPPMSGREPGLIDVRGSRAATGEEPYFAGNLTGYTGGPIRLTVVLGPTTFSITTDSPAFATGPIPYASAFTHFTRADLGSAAKLALGNEKIMLPTSYMSVDHISLEVSEGTPVERTTFGKIKALYLRRP